MNDIDKENVKTLLGMNLNLLIYLDVLLETCHISKAADKLNMSQPALSHALKELRRIFNDELLVRSDKKWVPTQKAEIIRNDIKKALLHCSQALTPHKFDPKHDTFRFKIMMTDYAGAILLPKLSEMLYHEAPNVVMDILPFEMNGSKMEEVDAAISFMPTPVASGFNELVLFEEYYICMVAKHHPRIINTLSLEQFLSEKHVVVREENGAVGVVNQALQLIGKARDIVLEVPNFLLFPHIISKTDLIITTTSRNAQLFMDKLPIKIFPAPLLLPTVPVKLIWHHRVETSAPNAWLRGCIERVARDVQ
jgi:DNA-binding transcriptional LysR family regulator